MIKKIYLFLVVFVSLQSIVFADEIIDAKGTVIPCKVETIMGGLVEYRSGGNLYSFTRESDSPVFNDYVDVQEKLSDKTTVVRYFGKILVKDMWSVILLNDNGKIDIPFYKIKFVGVYKP